MTHLLDMVAPESAQHAFPLSELSFNAVRGLPRSGWMPPAQPLMAGDREVREMTAGDQAELEQAWAPTERMGL